MLAPATLGQRNPAAPEPQDGLAELAAGAYRTIVVDPPWRYGLRPHDVTHRARPPYPTMTNAEIAALPIGAYAAPDAHLYLWTTNPKLFGDGLSPTPAEMVALWGFRYITLLTWHKLGAPGLGDWFRGDTEHVLFGVRGKAPIPPALRVSNHIAAQRGAHSVKPDRFFEIVERVSPGPYLELFARRRRYGWDVLGDEAPEAQASQAVLGWALP